MRGLIAMNQFRLQNFSAARLALYLVLASMAGCTKSEPAHFRLNTVEMALNNVPQNHQAAISTILEAMYGTPDEPAVLPVSGLDATKIALAAGPVAGTQQGQQHGLYRQHCGHCHGTSGDGAGPTALILNPYP